jgi:hypothetical protein
VEIGTFQSLSPREKMLLLHILPGESVVFYFIFCKEACGKKEAEPRKQQRGTQVWMVAASSFAAIQMETRRCCVTCVCLVHLLHFVVFSIGSCSSARGWLCDRREPITILSALPTLFAKNAF